MGKQLFKGGTPVGSEPLCRTCSSGQMMSGYRESEQITICDRMHPAMVVPFTIYECTGYYDKNRPSWNDMQKFALHIETAKPRGFKLQPGFANAVVTRLVPGTGEDEDEDD